MAGSDIQLVDPDSKADFSFDWTDFLGSDTISTSAWAVSPTGPTLSGGSKTNSSTTIFIEGCTFGKLYRLTNSIVTALGREPDRSIIIRCSNR